MCPRLTTVTETAKVENNSLELTLSIFVLYMRKIKLHGPVWLLMTVLFIKMNIESYRIDIQCIFGHDLSGERVYVP